MVLPMPDIVLATLNARYLHSSFGLRYLLANLGELRPRAALAEFIIQQRPVDVAGEILALHPRIVGLGVYIWNVTATTELVALLKKIQPGLIVVLGGPEVSHETDAQPIAALADYVIAGEGDLVFAQLCRDLLAGTRPPQKILTAPVPDFSQLHLPYDEYTDEDIAHRVIYVEASRSCPFSCEFCLSSLDVPVRQVELDRFLAEMDRLLERGARRFKFVDRTFNLNLAISQRILEFFLARLRPGLFLHFELVPDRLPPDLRQLLARFPAGTLQLEIGVQTFNADAAALISRRQNYEQLEENFRFLHRETHAHLHADLIAGLPGEDLDSFARGFDRLIALGPQEIQVGLLKRLRGAPISRHDAAWEMVYSPQPAYEILRTKLVDFQGLQSIRRFARYWDLIGNSGNFVETTPLLWARAPSHELSATATQPSPFARFSALTEWLYRREGRQHGIALVTLMQELFLYLTTEAGLDPERVAGALWRDFQRGNRGEVPPFLRPHLSRVEIVSARRRQEKSDAPVRQSRHLEPTKLNPRLEH